MNACEWNEASFRVKMERFTHAEKYARALIVPVLGKVRYI